MASTSSKRQKPLRPIGPIRDKNLKNPQEVYTHKEFVQVMRKKTSALRMWHDHKSFVKNPTTDTQEVLYALSDSKNDNVDELIRQLYPSFASIREMYIPSDTFCGLDFLEPGFVFDGEKGHQRIIDHCLSDSTKGKVLRKNGLGTPAALEVFISLFQSLLEQRGRCSAIVEGENALYLEFLGVMADIATDVAPVSRYYFVGFRARRLQPKLFLKTISRKNKNPTRDKSSKKFDDALTDKEELQVYNLVCEQMAIELSKENKDEKNIEKYRQQARGLFTDETKRSKRSDAYVKYVKEYLSTHRVYSESEPRVGSIWLFDDFEKEQSAGIGGLMELSLSTNLKNLL